ncbi:sensor domain-containing diguanylate cyclase [Kurthia gibsonii]|uniref:sensor domain-containing diguanylate cyclase n=1 Tax=Kurthia gibsonii TaxID=33946 RepID=UPI0031B682B6
MIIVFAIIIYIVLCSYIYMQKVNFSKKLALLQPMVESVENIRDVLYYCETHPEFKYQYLSPTIDDLLGPGKLEAHLRNPSAIYDLVHPDDYVLLEAKKNGEVDFTQPLRFRFRNHHGEYLWFEEYATPVYENGRYVAVQGLFRNIHEKVLLEEKLANQAIRDGLTNVYNRQYFQQQMEKYNQLHEEVLVGIIDLDGLKEVNDTCGHMTGDLMIQATAQTLQQYACENTVVARIGGDEFAVIKPNCDQIEFEQYIQNVRCHLYDVHEQIQMSVGSAYTPNAYGKMNELLHEADLQMYEQKKQQKQL